MLFRKTKPLLVFCETKDEHKIEHLSLEILGLALELANTLKCPVHTAVDKKGFEHLKSFPLSQVFTFSLPSNRYYPDRYVSFWSRLVRFLSLPQFFYLTLRLGRTLLQGWHLD